MYQVNPKEKLQQQLQYLENSCGAYDAGYKSEAIRIATMIRVLLHDTKNSTSLLTHLNAKHIQLFSTTLGQPDPNMKFFHGMGMARINADESRELVPNLNKLGIKSSVPANSWWTQTVFVLESRENLNRKSIVLTAANQDGGAHIDLKVKADYRALATDGAAGTYLRPTKSGYVVDTASNMHWVALRQMGFELLNSPELLELVSRINCGITRQSRRPAAIVPSK